MGTHVTMWDPLVPNPAKKGAVPPSRTQTTRITGWPTRDVAFPDVPVRIEKDVARFPFTVKFTAGVVMEYPRRSVMTAST